jgi:hypothetical protein
MRSSLVAAGLVTAVSVVLDVLPQYRGWVTLARGQEPSGGLQSRLSANGQRLQWSGAIGLGDAERVRRWLDAAPQVQLVELDSPGGRLDEARQIAQALAERGASTRVTGQCVDSCLLLFMAGRTRQLSPQGQLGFQRPVAGSWLPLFRQPVVRQVAEAYRGAGLPEAVIQQAVGGARSVVWMLDSLDIQSAGLVGVPNRPLDVALPFGPTAPLDEYVDALASSRFWRALAVRHPGSLEAAAQRMLAARADGGEGDTLQLAAQSVLLPLWRPLVALTEAPLQQKFAALLADELRALGSSGPPACALLLAGDIGVRRPLPVPLVLREAEWLMDALAETPTAAQPRPLTAIELEVVRRKLGSAAPQALAALQPGPALHRPGCSAATELLDAVASLPIPERRLALRLLAGQP